MVTSKPTNTDAGLYSGARLWSAGAVWQLRSEQQRPATLCVMLRESFAPMGSLSPILKHKRMVMAWGRVVQTGRSSWGKFYHDSAQNKCMHAERVWNAGLALGALPHPSWSSSRVVWLITCTAGPAKEPD